MPKPVYVICASDVIEDKATNLVTIFKVVEQIQLQQIPAEQLHRNGNVEAPPIPAQFGVLKVVAVWMKEALDRGDLLHEFVFDAGDLHQVLTSAAFSFAEDKLLRRFTLAMHGFPAPAQSCIATITSRVRSVESADWISQSYVLPITVIEQAAAVAPA